MKFENIIYDIETHPIIVAVVIFAVLFVFFDFIKKPAGSTSGQTTTGGITPTVSETYNQTYNSYPTTQPPTPTPTKPPIPTPKPKQIPIIPYDYFPSHTFPVKKPGTVDVVDTISYNGTSYKVIAGKAGRIWGVPFSGSQEEFLLYAPKSYY